MTLVMRVDFGTNQRLQTLSSLKNNASLAVMQPTVKRKASEDDDSAAKKAKSTPAANGASGSGTAASEAPKKRGRPSNKEVSISLCLTPVNCLTLCSCQLADSALHRTEKVGV